MPKRPSQCICSISRSGGNIEALTKIVVPILLNRDGFEKCLTQLKTLRRGANEIVAPKHTHAGISMSSARSQVETRGKIVDRDRASVRGNDL